MTYTNKIITSLVVLFTLQLLSISCCPDPRTYKTIYTGVTVEAWDTAGFQSSVIEEVANKKAFGLTVSINSEYKPVALNRTSSSSFGFGLAYAFQCEDDEFIVDDTVRSLDIVVVNPKTNEKTKVNENFISTGNDNERLTVTEFFQQENEWGTYFQFELENTDAIPDTAVFMIDVSMESGTVFTEQTHRIAFVE